MKTWGRDRYTFIITAINVAGEGAPARYNATPYLAPAAPSITAATPGDCTITLTWTATTDDVPVSSYRVSYVGIDDTTDTAFADITNVRTHEFTGLTKGESYTFSVAALNGDQVGPTANKTATPYTAPAAPGSFSANSRKRQSRTRMD